jgi:BirA family biotin operon repressor/biotin-[acetyl-CoA-carboxylase] ligase
MGGKEELLERLKKAEGRWVSGESLSAELAVSRTAVWKRICKLRDEGYDIQSSSRKGYLLQGVPDRLLPREIRSGLRAKVFGRGEIFHFPETDSTNSRAKELAGRGAPEGTIVLGRSRESDVCIAHSSVSRDHARLSSGAAKKSSSHCMA